MYLYMYSWHFIIRRSTIRYAPIFDEIESPRQQETLINDALLFDKLPYSIKIQFPLKIELESVNCTFIKFDKNFQVPTFVSDDKYPSLTFEVCSTRQKKANYPIFTPWPQWKDPSIRFACLHFRPCTFICCCTFIRYPRVLSSR